jgi:hypothetical protein
MTAKRKQASPKKAPKAERFGRFLTKATVGLAVGAGRITGQVAKGAGAGLAETGRNMKKGFNSAYDDIKS